MQTTIRLSGFSFHTHIHTEKAPVHTLQYGQGLKVGFPKNLGAKSLILITY